MSERYTDSSRFTRDLDAHITGMYDEDMETTEKWWTCKNGSILDDGTPICLISCRECNGEWCDD